MVKGNNYILFRKGEEMAYPFRICYLQQYADSTI